MTAALNCEKGTHAELLFCAEAGARGWQVLIPMGHSSTVDVWIFRPPGRPVSVQVKRAHPDRDGDYCLTLARGCGDRKTYQAGDFDILAAYLPGLNEFVLWRFDDINARKKIRYSPKRHRQPANWELLDDVAQSLIISGAQDGRCPTPLPIKPIFLCKTAKPPRRPLPSGNPLPKKPTPLPIFALRCAGRRQS